MSSAIEASTPPQRWAFQGSTRRCGSLTFAVRATEEAVGWAAESVLEGFTPVRAGEPPAVTLDIVDDGTDHSHRFELRSPGARPATRLSAPMAAGCVVERLDRLVLDAGQESLHVHAAAVADGYRAAVLVAPSGGGKTTLCATLVHSGLGYLTDEMVIIDPPGTAVRAFAKPLSIKHGAESHLPFNLPTRGTIDVGWSTLVPPGLLGGAGSAGASDGASPVRFGLVAILELAGDGRGVVVEVSRAEAVVALLANSFDAARLGPPALLMAARAVAPARAIGLHIGSVADSALAVRELLASPLPPGSVEVVPRGDRQGPGPARASDVSSVMVDGRAVLLRDSGEIALLDPWATLIWALADGGLTTAEIVEEVAEASGQGVSRVSRGVEAHLAESITAGLLAGDA